MGDRPKNQESLPGVVSVLSEGEIVERLDASARRGKLAGFEAGRAGELFRVSAYGTPFDRFLVARAQTVSSDTKLGFELKWARKMPAVFIIALVVSVWPGLPLTDTMLAMWFGWYERLVSPDGWFRTWMWYLPLTVPFLPLVWRSAMGKSTASSREHAIETIDKIAGVVEGQTQR